MLINRDNYETIFLMYIDNELSDAERKSVEEFLEANEDLREEMASLQLAVLPDEDSVFVPKTMLYKNGAPVESVQESLLLLLDNELNGDEKESLRKHINENATIREEWQVLQKTVLDQEDKVVFDDKKTLYRHTERVIPMNFWRAAAAILVGLGIFTGISLYNNKSEVGGEIAKETKVLKTDNKTTAIVPDKPVVSDQQNIVVSQVNDVKESEDDVPSLQVKDQVIAANKDVPKKSIPVVTKNDLPINDAQLVKQESAPQKKIVQSANENTALVIQESPVQKELTNEVIKDVDMGQVKNGFARLAVNEEDPDRFLNMEEDKVTRSKLGGIIRQVKRVVERNTKIKTSNGLRIGGFEIAIK